MGLNIKSVEFVHMNKYRNRRWNGDKGEYEIRKSRLYIWPEGETIMQNFMSRWSRPVAAYRKMLPVVLEAAGLPLDTKASWNQRGGCACGCSPSFVLDTRTGIDYHVTVTER